LKPLIIIPVAVAILVGTFLIVSSFGHHNPVIENRSPLIFNTNYLLGISNGTIQVPLRSYTFYHFSAPNGSSTARVTGNFTMEGNGSNLRIYLLDEVNFSNWKDGHQFNSYYDSGNNTIGTIDVIVPSGQTLYLIYDNTFSHVQSKAVYSKINLVYS
jgi:hypothetical protein